MKCPHCNKELTENKQGDVVVFLFLAFCLLAFAAATVLPAVLHNAK